MYDSHDSFPAHVGIVFHDALLGFDLMLHRRMGQPVEFKKHTAASTAAPLGTLRWFGIEPNAGASANASSG